MFIAFANQLVSHFTVSSLVSSEFVSHIRESVCQPSRRQPLRKVGSTAKQRSSGSSRGRSKCHHSLETGSSWAAIESVTRQSTEIEGDVQSALGQLMRRSSSNISCRDFVWLESLPRVRHCTAILCIWHNVCSWGNLKFNRHCRYFKL